MFYGSGLSYGAGVEGTLLVLCLFIVSVALQQTNVFALRTAVIWSLEEKNSTRAEGTSPLDEGFFRRKDRVFQVVNSKCAQYSFGNKIILLCNTGPVSQSVSLYGS